METAVVVALGACGIFFLVGLLTGVWKYVCIMRSSVAQAPVYVDICHRAALMYSFACLVLARFAELSVWSELVNLWATLAPTLFFALAVLSYGVHGWLRDTGNQLQRPHVLGRGTIPGSWMAFGMWALIAAEIGGFAVLFAGALRGMLMGAQ